MGRSLPWMVVSWDADGRLRLVAVVTVGTVIVAGNSVIRTVRGFYRLDFAVVSAPAGLRSRSLTATSPTRPSITR